MEPDKRLVGRRALLRGFITVSAGAASSAVLAACTPAGSDSGNPANSAGRTFASTVTNPSPSRSAASTHAIPRELAVIPQEHWSPAARQGTLVELSYETYESATYEQKTQRLTKRAIVYLPYEYTANQQYNVFYLMHGGWSNETTTLGTPDDPTTFKNVLDNAIAAGEMKPLIIVCPTYNNTSPDDSADFSRALTLTQNYHRELLSDLLPTVESTYSTYAEDVSAKGFMASRDHRGFGGFSMGAVATWRTFQNGLDYFRYFLPMSCGTPLDMDNILTSVHNHDQADYFVWVLTGAKDFAHQYDQSRVDLMRNSPSFAEADTETDGNFTFRVKDGYSHDGIAATEYTYNGLRWFWNP